jgi:hypothetical protein
VKPLLALLGAVEQLALRLLPWDRTSQHSAWIAGYMEGARDAQQRQTETEGQR